MIKKVWFDARSTSRPFVTGWERYVTELALGFKFNSEIHTEYLHSSSKINLIYSDLFFSSKSKNFKVAHFPTYPSFFKSQATNQIITIHDLSLWKLPKDSSFLGANYYKFLFKKSILQCDAIIVPSQTVKNEIIEYFNIKENKVFVIRHGNSLPQGKKLVVNKPYFLSIGTVEPRKNLDFYSEAIRSSGLENKFDFIHVGRRGWAELPRNFKYIRAHSDQQLADLIFNSHCVVVPSKYEGFGLTMLEAHGQKKSVILSNDSALLELKEKSDLVFNLKSIDTLIDCMIQATKQKNELTNHEMFNVKKYNWKKSISDDMNL